MSEGEYGRGGAVSPRQAANRRLGFGVSKVGLGSGRFVPGAGATTRPQRPSLVFLLIGLESRICDWLVSVEPFYRMARICDWLVSVEPFYQNGSTDTSQSRQEEAVPPMSRLGANQIVEN